MSNHGNMPAELVCAALRMAIKQRQPARGLIVHSDRSNQYENDLQQHEIDIPVPLARIDLM
jgi:transposase InsO family protein